MKKIITVLGALALMVMPVVAADLGGSAQAQDEAVKSVTNGLYVSIGVGMTNDNLDASIPSAIGVDLGAQGIQGSLGAGIDIPLGNSAFIGVFGDIAWRDAEVNAFLGTVTAQAGYDASYSLGARVGTHLTEASSIYINGGWTRLAEGSASAAGVGSISLPDLDGWFIGGGVSHHLNSQMSVGLEGRYRWYDTETVGGLVAVDADGMDVMMRLNYKIGGFFN